MYNYTPLTNLATSMPASRSVSHSQWKLWPPSENLTNTALEVISSWGSTQLRAVQISIFLKEMFAVWKKLAKEHESVVHVVMTDERLYVVFRAHNSTATSHCARPHHYVTWQRQLASRRSRHTTTCSDVPQWPHVTCTDRRPLSRRRENLYSLYSLFVLSLCPHSICKTLLEPSESSASILLHRIILLWLIRVMINLAALEITAVYFFLAKTQTCFRLISDI